jgi:hypothetical protein
LSTENQSQLPKSTDADEINRLHEKIIGNFVDTANDIILLGEMLSKKKEELGHGNWLPWAESNLKFTAHQAAKYMRVYERRAEIQIGPAGPISSLNGITRLLADPSGPPPRPKAIAPDSPEKRALVAWAIEQWPTWGNEEIARFCGVQVVTVISVRCGDDCSKLLAECEANIEAALPRVKATAAALKEIRDRKLYRAEFETFEEFCASYDLFKAAPDLPQIILEMADMRTKENP